MVEPERAATPQQPPAQVWSELDEAWRRAFEQAWEALRSDNIAVGACVSTADGQLLHAARNRVHDRSGPPGEVWGSALAHAEINVLARVGFRLHQQLLLTTTLEPCLQCAAAIRLAKVATVRFAGADRYWQGCHDFGRLSVREAEHVQPLREGPRTDEVGLFGSVIALLGSARGPSYERWLRAAGDAPLVELAERIEAHGLAALTRLDVAEGFAELAPRLRELRQLDADRSSDHHHLQITTLRPPRRRDPQP